MLDSLLKDVRFAFRQLRQRPGFTITAVLVLALGLGANAAIFTVIDAVLLKPLPFPHPETLVALFEKDVLPDDPYNWVAAGNYLDWRRDSSSFENMAATSGREFNLSSAGNSFTPLRVEGALCSDNLFDTLGVKPLLGRTFRPAEDRPGAAPVAVIGYGLWKQRFGGSPDVLKRQIRLDEVNHDIIGVMPDGFAYPQRHSNVWLSLESHVKPYQLRAHSSHFLLVIGRLKPGMGIELARQEIDAMVSRFHKTHPAEVMGKGASVVRLDWYLVRDVKTSLLILLASVACLLLIACVNIANLLLTRAAGRHRELAIRAAIGATRLRIVRQLLIESVAVSLLGSVAGLIIASWAASLMASHAPHLEAMVQLQGLRVNPAVLLFTIGLALVTGVLAGLFPALSASRTELVDSLKDGNRSATAGRSQGRTRDILVALEVALSMVLLIAAGLLIRSFAQVENVRSGLRTENTTTFNVDLPEEKYKERAKVAAFVRQLVDSTQSIAGVNGAGIVSCLPLDGHCNDSVFRIEGHPLPPGQMIDLLTREANPSYFKTAGIPLLRGRVFNQSDNRGYDDQHPGLDPVLISEAAARKYFPGMDPIGQHLDWGTDAGDIVVPGSLPKPKLVVVGVVGDVLADVEEPVTATIYMPLADGDHTEIYLVVHSFGDPKTIVSSVRAEFQKLDPDLPIHDIRTFRQIAADSIQGRQFSLVLLAIFAALALVLAAIGLYGVVSYGVSQRTAEIGIRMALGAARNQVSRMILVQGIRPALAGILLGIVAAALASQALRSLLFGVGPADPVTFAVVPFVLLLVVATSCLVPALRATRIDPTVALRIE